MAIFIQREEPHLWNHLQVLKMRLVPQVIIKIRFMDNSYKTFVRVLYDVKDQIVTLTKGAKLKGENQSSELNTRALSKTDHILPCQPDLTRLAVEPLLLLTSWTRTPWLRLRTTSDEEIESHEDEKSYLPTLDDNDLTKPSLLELSTPAPETGDKAQTSVIHLASPGLTDNLPLIPASLWSLLHPQNQHLARKLLHLQE